MIEQSEIEIIGSWEMKDGRMVEDDACQRIRTLVETELQQVAVSDDGWEKLYRDPKDGRFWESLFPQSEMHGGGPPALRVVSSKTAELPGWSGRKVREHNQNSGKASDQMIAGHIISDLKSSLGK